MSTPEQRDPKPPRSEPRRPPTGTAEPRHAYERFRAMYADSLPMRGFVAFQLALHASGLRPSEVSDDWLRSLRDDWVYGESDDPFEEERLNRAYHDAARAALGR